MWVILLWETYPSYYNGLFSPLLVRRFRCQKSRSQSVFYEQYETSYLFYVTLSFSCNIICYLISAFSLLKYIAFTLVTPSGAATDINVCLFVFYGISTLVVYLMSNPSLYKKQFYIKQFSLV